MKNLVIHREMKNKYQQVNFSYLDEFIEFLPENELRIFRFLRAIVLECLPGCIEKLSYNVPYYRKNRGICFLWPASVTWGKRITYEGVRMGFNYGYLLQDEINYLNKGDRKQVFWRDFKSMSEIDPDLLKAYLYEAEEVDRSFKKSPA